MIARVKTTVIDTTQAMTVARQIALQTRRLRGSAAAPAGPIDLSYWYGTEHLHALAALVAPIARVDDVNLRRFLQVAFSVTARRLSLADPRVAVPVRLRPDRCAEEHWLGTPANTPKSGKRPVGKEGVSTCK